MKKWLKNFKKDQRGLTLVELLAVVVILAIVAAIAFVLIGNIIENSRKDAHISNAQQVISAAKLAESSGDAFQGNQTTADFTNAKLKPYLGDIVDPWEKEDYTTITVTKSGSSYSVTLSNNNTKDCPIENEPETNLSQGRDVVCES